MLSPILTSIQIYYLFLRCSKMHKSLNDCVLQSCVQTVLEEPLQHGGVLISTFSVLVHCIKSLFYDYYHTLRSRLPIRATKQYAICNI